MRPIFTLNFAIRSFLKINLFLLLSFVHYSIFAQTVYQYVDDINGIPFSVNANATGSNLLRGTGLSSTGVTCISANQGFGSTDWYNSTAANISTADANGEFVYLTITPKAGYRLNLTGLKASLRSPNGPTSVRYSYTIGSGSYVENGSSLTPGTSSSCTNSGIERSWTFASSIITTETVTFKIYGFNSPSSAGEMQLRNIEVAGAIECNPALVASISPSMPAICENDQITLTGLVTGGSTPAYTHLWEIVSGGTGTGNLSSPGTNSSNIFTGLTAGSVNVRYKAAYGSAPSCEVISPNEVVTVNGIPTIALSGTLENCIGQTDEEIIYTTPTHSPDKFSLNFNPTAESAGYADDLNVTLSGSPISVTIPVAASPSSYFATLVVENSTTGCQSPVYNLEFIQHDLPEVTIGGSNEVCQGANITLVGSSSPAKVSDSWLSSMLSIAIVSSEGIVSGLAEGNTDITYTVTDINGCTNTSDNHNVEVNALPSGTLSFTESSGSISDDGEVCSGGEVVFTATSGFTNYNFKLDGNSVQNGVSNTYTASFTTSGVITVEVTDGNTCTTTFTGGNITVGTCNVTNVNTGKNFVTIQAAINDAGTINGHVINVGAGTYTEDIVVNKSVELRGPNYGISPNTGSRLSEAIVQPATSGSDAIFVIQASNVRIDGFKLEGDNSSLTSGVIGTNGADIDTYEGIVYYDPANTLVVNNTKIENNIIQNVQYFGIDLFGWGNFNNPSTSGHLINDNLFKDFGTYSAGNGYDKWGGGVLLYNDNYTKISNNVMTNVRLGIQTGNFHDPNPGDIMYQNIENNNIQARRRGIFYNLHTGTNVAPLTVSNNTISALSNSNELDWDGILVSSISNAQGTITGNTINGSAVGLGTISQGIEIWNVKNDASTIISGGSIEGVDIGVFINNYDGYNSNATNGAHATVSNVTISPKATGTGIRILDNPSSTHANVVGTIGGGVIINAGTEGLVLENSSAASNSVLSDIAFSNVTGSYIKLINNATNLDATSATFDGQTGATASLSENFAIEDKILHKIDNNSLGFVLVKADNDFVTTNSGTIQQGVNVASAGFTVNVGPGTFTENVTVNKYVKIIGSGNTTIVQGVSNTGNLFTYPATASGTDGMNRAALESMKLTNAQRGIYTSEAANFLTVKDVNFDALTTYGIQINNTSASTDDWSIENSVFNAITGAAIQLGTAANVDKLSILNSIFTGNTSGALYAGQNSAGTGSFNDVTITGSTFTSNGATNNQAALYIEKLSNATISENTFTDNGISTNPRSIIINLKYDDYSDIDISDNVMNETRGGTMTNGYGIFLAARNDSPSYNSNPASVTNVTLTGNEIASFQNGIGLENNVNWATTMVENNSVSNANTSIYGVGANAGQTLEVHNNSFTNSATYSVANGVSGSNINADCNWFGSTSLTTIQSKIVGDVTLDSWLINGTDDAPATKGFQPVTGSCIGSPVLITATTPDPITCGETTGGINIMFSGGTGPYNISWTGAASGSATGISSGYDVTGLIAGIYTIVVTDTYGSEATAEDIEVEYLPVANTTGSTFYASIQEAINAASNGDMIEVCEGTYSENIIVNKELVINGANVDTDCNSTRNSESIISVASGVPITISASNVTLNGFEITAPASSNAIVIGNVSGASVVFNKIHDIGTTFTGGNVHAVIHTVPNASNSDLTISDNCIENISSTSLTGFSSSAIGILQSTSTGVLDGLTIERNKINSVTVNSGTWPTGKIAYGIQINAGSSSYLTTTGKVLDAIISNNEISNLSGHIATGIGLEGNTENAIVSNNIVSNLSGTKTANRAGGGFDVNGLKFESNKFVSTITVENNSFNTETYSNNSNIGSGYAVVNYVPNSTAALGCNWYGTAVYNELEDNATFTGKIFSKDLADITFVPYLSSGGDGAGIGFQPTGMCDGSPIEITSISTSPQTCNSDGNAEITFSGGLSPYEISWTDGGTNTGSTSSITSPHTVTDLPSGTYTFTLTDNVGSMVSSTATVIYLPVTNVTDAPNTYYATIQEAIDAADPSDVIEVCEGTYSEDLSISKALTVKGANFGIAGNGMRTAESVLFNSRVTITGNGPVVFDGFKILRDDAYAGDVVSMGGNTEVTFSNNILERNATVTGTIVRAIVTSAGTGEKTISSNKLTGDGSNLFSGHKTWNNGIYINGNASLVNVLENDFTNMRTAINIDDHQEDIKLEGNNFSNNGTHLAFGGVSPTVGTFVLDSNNIELSGSAIVNLSNVDISFRVDLTSSTYKGVPLSTSSDADLFEFELQLFHKDRSSRKGKVIYKTGNQYVNNITSPFTKIDLIQNSVKYADTNDTINLQAGTYAQRVIIDKSELTLKGITSDKSLYILDGTGLAANGSGVGSKSGIKINTGITNIDIKNLSITGNAGTNGNSDAGVYAVGQNNSLTIDNISSSNNTNASGIYANGPVDGVSITNSTISNNGTGARGIVIWNGFKENITITGNTVNNNNCCGIELQDGSASAVNVSDNIIDIGSGDNGIGLTSLNELSGSNIIDNNTITGGGRFGIEIKNPAGGVTVSNNNVSLTTQNSDLRDRAGIAVLRRGYLTGQGYVDIPNGVTISGNTVEGFQQSSNSEGFGIVVEGTNHVISNNILNNNDIGIQQQAGHTPYTAETSADGDQSNLSDFYFGRGNSPELCNVTLTGNTYSGNGSDERIVVGGGTGTIVTEITPTVADPADVEVCNGDEIMTIVFAGNEIPGVVYNWTNSNTAIGLPASGLGSITGYTASNTTTLAISATITVTPVVNGCEGLSQDFTITINPTPSVAVIANQSLCDGEITSIISFSGTGASYTWVNDNDAIGLSLSGTGDIASFTATNTTGVPQIAYVTVTPNFAGSSLSCAGPSQSFSITVKDDSPAELICQDDVELDNDPTLCTAEYIFELPKAYDPVFFDGFENVNWQNTNLGWSNYNSQLSREPSGLLISSSGVSHGLIDNTVLPASPNDYTGAFSRLGGYSTTFGNGFRNRVDVYIDLNDPAVSANTYGWDVSSAVSTQSNSHRRDFIFHTASNATGNVLIGGSNGTNFTRRNDLAAINHYEITASGWYTFEWMFEDKGDGTLKAEMSVLDNSGSKLWTETRNDPSDIIATQIGGSRYMWFTFMEADNLRIDNVEKANILNTSSNIASGFAFPVGTTTVTVTSEADACGVQAVCTFDVTIKDVDAPVFTNCPTDVVICADVPNHVWTHVTLSDQCNLVGGLQELTYTLSGATTSMPIPVLSFDGSTQGSQTFNEGVTTVTYSGIDAAGNMVSNLCSFTVTVNPVAVVNPGTYSAICQGTSVVLNGSISGASSSATWSDGGVGGSFAPDANTLTATYSPPTNFSGTVTLTLTSDDPSGPCTEVSADAELIVNPLPTVYNVAGGGVYCPGTSAAPITLSGSQVGVNYTLKSSSNPFFFGSTKAGTGSAISFTAPTNSGDYFIEATNSSTGCKINMAGNAIIGVGVPPVAEIANLSNPVCFGGDNGSFEVNVTEGFGPFTYALNAGSFSSSNSFSSLISGTYSVTVKDANGCTSTVSTTLTDPAAVLVVTNNPAFVCTPETVDLTLPAVTIGSTSGLTFSYFEDEAATIPLLTPEIVSTGGTFYVVGTNSFGCSDTTAVDVIVNEPTTSTTTESACGSFEWNGTTYTESGVYTFETTNAAGCDSVATLNLTIKESTTSTTTESACGSFEWNGTMYTESGVYTFETTNAAGCDSVATLNLTIKESTTSTTTESVCGSFEWNGTMYTESGVYTFETTNAAGCDSVATLNLTIKESTTSTTTESACGSFEWNGTTYTESGVYTFETTNAAGCDSVATLNLTIKESTTSTTTESACGSFEWNGTTYTESGVYTFETTNAAGCDSVATLNLTIKESTTSTTTESACGSFEWNGTTYTESGVYTFETTNAAGCDSVATLNLTIKESTTSTTTESACGGFEWNGTTYTESGVYTFETTNAAGCDSVATLNLTIKESTTSTTTESACGSFEWNGTTYTESGVYTFETTNAAGCDSVATLNLTIKEPTTSTTTESACGSFEWNGTTYTESGVYTFETTNAAGCDSVATLNLTIKESTTSTTTESACGSFEWNGTMYTESGVYTFETTNAAGCDSVATLNLTIKESTTSTTTESVCGSFEWNGTMYTESGVYTFETTNAAGCDSVATLNLTIKESTTSTTTESACGSFEWNGTTYTESGVYTFETTNAAGCDSVATLNLTIKESTTSTTTESACGSFEWNGTTYTESGVYTFETTNAAGCDSVATLNLTIKESTTSTTTESACGSFEWNGTTYTESGVYTFETTNAAGCDSVATLNLTIKESTTSTTTESACGSFEWNGTTYTESGVYTFETTNAAGCDSVATLNLTIKESTTSTTTESACGSFEWNGTTYTESGVYTFETTNAAGCDSVATLNLTIKESTTSTTTESVCGSFEWNGTTYTESGVYTFETTNAAGCDSIATLILTINTPATLVVTNPGTAASVDLTAPAVTAGSTLPVGTVFSYHTDAAGTLPLTTPNAVITSGTYYIKATTVEGCESIAAVVVIISSCPDDIVLVSPTDDKTTTGVLIEAGKTIGATNKIETGAGVIYGAGNSITLSPGFEAKGGAVFKAEIGGCGSH